MLPMRIICLVLAFFLSSCDTEGKEECAWTLEPEIKNQGATAPGYIPVCARKRILREGFFWTTIYKDSTREDCRFQTTLEFAEKSWRKTFRYVDIDADMTKFPRVIKNIKFCERNR
jgi:hypothetical protein